MIMKMCRNILGVLGALLLTVLMGCVEEFDAEFSDMPTEGLVVEGNIISDSTIVFQLSKTLPLDKIKDNVDLFNTFTDVNAELSVKGSDGTSWRGFVYHWRVCQYHGFCCGTQKFYPSTDPRC